MAVNREYRCIAHDHEFESMEEGPACPFGCSPAFVKMEFRTPIAVRGNTRSKTIDHFQRQLAEDYGMTDMRGDKDGSSVMHNTPTRSGGAKVYNDFQQAKWAPSLFQPQQGWATNPDTTAPPVYNHDLPGHKTGMEPLLKGAAKYAPLMAKTTFVKQKGEK